MVVTAVVLIVGAGLISGFAAGQNLLAGPAGPTPRTSPTTLAVVTPSPPPRVPPPTDGGTVPTPSQVPATPAVTPTPSAPPADLVRATVPLVPVVSFWSNAQTISREQILDAIAGVWNLYPRVVVPTGAASAIADALGIAPVGMVELGSDELQAAVADGALGLVPLPQVTPAVRALAINGVDLFGNDRIGTLDDWPIDVTLDLPPLRWEQANTWTLVAGGDIMLDRGIAEQVTILGKGVEFPWDGGTVSITGRHCCTPFGWPVPETQRTGHAGAVRSLFSDADLAIANLESPVKENFTYHTTGLVFTADPRLLGGLDNAGLDFVTLANNHIGNGGRSGIVGTVDALDAIGIAHSGAGTDLREAAAPAYLEAGGQRIAIIGCAVVGGYFASDTGWGGLRCSDPATLAAIADARAQADVVIVFPHWGREYQDVASRGQRKLADAWMAAGVDLVIGSHPHWAGSIEEFDGRLVFYSLGNFVFDQTWSEPTMEGLILELTFQGNRLVQAQVHPTFIMSAAQPNLLDYNGGGSDVLARVREASRRLDY